MPVTRWNLERAPAFRCLQFGSLYLFHFAITASAANKAAPKPTDEDCLACHGDTTMTTEANGKQVSLYVNREAFKNSIHGTMFTCVDCHSDVKRSPHETTPTKVSCAHCHADQQAAYDRSYHAKAIKAGGWANGNLRQLPRKPA